MSSKKKVLVLNGQYLPGYKGGGPIRSIANLIDNLYEYFDFYVLTSDRDFREENPYDNIKFNEWQKIGHANVYYMKPEEQSIFGFMKIINSIEYDLLYLNGYFSPIYTIKPLILRKLKLIKTNKILLSPRGDFSQGHLNIKKFKKITYIKIAKLFGLYNNIYWQATSELELEDIKRIYKTSKIIMAPNLSINIRDDKYRLNNKNKQQGQLKMVFLSRIAPKKNLLYALNVLASYNRKGNILFDIYGPIEDKEYWSKCEEVIRKIPKNIQVNYLGEIKHDEVFKMFNKYHVFFFPTLGENFGHVILEAMLGGCLLLISDQTPWRNLSDLKVGWDLSLDNIDEFRRAIEELIEMDEEHFYECSKRAYNYAFNKCLEGESIKQNIQMLQKVIDDTTL